MKFSRQAATTISTSLHFQWFYFVWFLLGFHAYKYHHCKLYLLHSLYLLHIILFVSYCSYSIQKVFVTNVNYIVLLLIFTFIDMNFFLVLKFTCHLMMLLMRCTINYLFLVSMLFLKKNKKIKVILINDKMLNSIGFSF